MKAYALWLWELVKRAGIGFLLFLDCVGSVLAGESFHRTLSAKAHNAAAKQHKYWGWTESFIDWLFHWPKFGLGAPGHCKTAAEREAKQTSVWIGWMEKSTRVWGLRP